jgi:hypothetical protein
MKLTYWTAECIEDSNAYSIRTKTKREAVALKAEYESDEGTVEYGPVNKVVVSYDDAFDLLTECLREGGAWWEPVALNSKTLA